MHLTTSFDARHSAVMVWVRFLVSAWLIVLTALLCSIGDWWGTVLLLPVALALWGGWRLLRGAQK